MSRVQTISVPSITALSATVAPATLARSSPNTVPQRVLVRNTGPITVLLSTDAGSISSLSSVQSAYRLDPNVSEVFVLEVADTLYAVGVGGGAVVSIAVSPAFPLGTSWGGS